MDFGNKTFNFALLTQAIESGLIDSETLEKKLEEILLDNNLDHNLITSLMGHTDLSMTEGHYHRNRKSDEKRSAILSSLNEFKTSTFGIAKLEENNETLRNKKRAKRRCLA